MRSSAFTFILHPLRVIWSGSATGAMRSARRNCMSFCCAGEGVGIAGAGVWRSLPGTCVSRPGGCGHRVRRRPAEPRSARSVCAVPRYGSYSARPVCKVSAGYSDDSRVRGAGLRDSARLLALERRGALFTPGEDFLVAQNGQEMQQHLQTLLENPQQAEAMAQRGLQTILARHTCAHRVDELLNIYELSPDMDSAGNDVNGLNIAFFGFQPGFRVLERRGDLLPGHHSRAARAGASGHIL